MNHKPFHNQASKARCKMPKANEKEAIIATQHREFLGTCNFTSLHRPSSLFVTIITSKPQQQRNSFKSNLHSFIILDDSLPLQMIWAISQSIGSLHYEVDRLTCCCCCYSSSFTQGIHRPGSQEIWSETGGSNRQFN